MNEILAMKQIKRVVRCGIPRNEAKTLVREVIDVVGTNDEGLLVNSINYAISLTYRIEFSKIVK